MRRRILGSVVGGFFLFGGADAPAEAAQYNVAASAGNEGDAHESNSDPDAHASFTRSEDTATESYDAGANANGGSLHARALRSGLLQRPDLDERVRELTDFPPVLPVPEPGAPLLVASGAALLAALRRRLH